MYIKRIFIPGVRLEEVALSDVGVMLRNNLEGMRPVEAEFYSEEKGAAAE